eukprot:6200078-Pleurochrysis_carterae.AAC.2
MRIDERAHAITQNLRRTVDRSRLLKVLAGMDLSLIITLPLRDLTAFDDTFISAVYKTVRMKDEMLQNAVPR